MTDIIYDWMEEIPEYDATHVTHRTINGLGEVGQLIYDKPRPKHTRVKRRKHKDHRIGWTKIQDRLDT